MERKEILREIFRTISSLDKVAVLPVGLFTGEIRMYTSINVAPPYNWFRCDGSKVSRTTYARLFEVIMQLLFNYQIFVEDFRWILMVIRIEQHLLVV